MVGARAI